MIIRGLERPVRIKRTAQRPFQDSGWIMDLAQICNTTDILQSSLTLTDSGIKQRLYPSLCAG